MDWYAGSSGVWWVLLCVDEVQMDGMRQSRLDQQINQPARSTQAVQMQSCILRNFEDETQSNGWLLQCFRLAVNKWEFPNAVV